jgi:membrane protein YqaA with SNARE-associated domain
VIHDIREWLVEWADSPAGPIALAALTTSESIFFPIPTDPLLIALALRNPDAALLLAALTIATSVIGGVIGHWLGLRFGRPLLARLHNKHIERIEEMFHDWGFWAIAIAGLTPIPYKVFTIGAGVFDIPRTQFIVASIVGRGIRFGTYGVLIFLWGDRFREFIEQRFHFMISAVAIGVIIALIICVAWRLQRSHKPTAHDEPHV